ncbi:hypothetical protein [Ferrimonas sp.]|uniref:hypothetical protein n=1 Tax=Ferrimonas sp. TaxID=2080861 RepID=UPI003A8D269E
MKFHPYWVVLPAMFIAGCASTPSIQTKKVDINNRPSTAKISRAAEDFEDSDIEVPAYFDTQGLQDCTFDVSNESDQCPLKRSVIRMYFDDNRVSGRGKGVDALSEFNNQKMVHMFENQIAGLNRFRIVTRDNIVASEMAVALSDQGAEVVAKRAESSKPLFPDYILKIDTVKTAETFYAEYNGQANYTIEMTSSVIDPFTKEKMSSPNIGKIRVNGTDVRAKTDLVFSEVNGRYYTGFNYEDSENVLSVMNDMASRGFDLLITRLLSEMPSTAQVLGFKGDRLSLDRGRNAGILPNEVMIIFQYEAGFVEPIGVATVTPSSHSSNGRIIKWKRAEVARKIRQAAKKSIYQPSESSKVFAVSVGTPPDFLDSRT